MRVGRSFRIQQQEVKPGENTTDELARRHAQLQGRGRLYHADAVLVQAALN